MTLKVIQRSSGLPFLPTIGVEHTGLEGKALSFLVSEGESPSWFLGARLPRPNASRGRFAAKSHRGRATA